MARLALLILCAVLLAASHLGASEPGLALLWLSVPLLALLRRRFVPYLIASLGVVGAADGLQTAWQGAAARLALDPMLAAAIAALLALLCLTTAWLWMRQATRQAYGEPGEAVVAPLVAGSLTAILLGIVLVKVPVSALLLERFMRGGGWLHVLWLGVYAAWLTRLVLIPKLARRWRPRVWVLFSVVFYTQLAIGLLGAESFLMTGELHLPIPAIIAAGPLYRGHGFFMAILFGASVLVVGPAWCSWLCYLGGWDNLAALGRQSAGRLPRWRAPLRFGILVGVVVVALALGLAGVPGSAAAMLGGLFGIAGIGIIATLSRRRGVMVHCTAYCPIGWLATRLGKLNPFRITIDDSCTNCMACTRFCRFDALREEQIRARKVGEACTLCGDCVTVCQKTFDIHYTFPGLSPKRARTVYLSLVVTMHAAFMGVAMI